MFYGIPPGRYTFVVTASNYDGVWNTEVAGLPVVVLPPFWHTWWFIASTGTALGLLGVGAYERRVRRVRREHARQIAFSRKLIDSQEHERRRISNEVHDSLGEHVTVIRKRAQAARAALSDSTRLDAELQAIGAG